MKFTHAGGTADPTATTGTTTWGRHINRSDFGGSFRLKSFYSFASSSSKSDKAKLCSGAKKGTPQKSISVALSLLETEVGKREHWCHTIQWSYRYAPLPSHLSCLAIYLACGFLPLLFKVWSPWMVEKAPFFFNLKPPGWAGGTGKKTNSIS